jgi:hypothetical protein
MECATVRRYRETSFTDTEQKLLKILADGMPHRWKELHTCLPDDLGTSANLQCHIWNIRQKLRPHGYDIICEFYKRSRKNYRQVRLLNNLYRE